MPNIDLITIVKWVALLLVVGVLILLVVSVGGEFFGVMSLGTAALQYAHWVRDLAAMSSVFAMVGVLEPLRVFGAGIVTLIAAWASWKVIAWFL